MGVIKKDDNKRLNILLYIILSIVYVHNKKRQEPRVMAQQFSIMTKIGGNTNSRKPSQP